MRRENLSILAICGIVAALGLALVSGCGGDDEDGTSASGGGQTDGQTSKGSGGGGASGSEGDDATEGGGAADGSKAQFIKEADAICEKARRKTSSEFERFVAGSGSSLGDESELYGEVATEVVIPRIEERIDGIEALDTPASAEEAKDAVIAGFEGLIERIEADPVKFNATSEAAVIDFQELVKGQGFKKCNGYLG